MIAIEEGASISPPLGLAYVVFLTTLTCAAIATYHMSVISELRRNMTGSESWAESIRDFVDSLADDCRRTARRIGDALARTTHPKTTVLMKSVLNRTR
jgi:hypothetical protein